MSEEIPEEKPKRELRRSSLEELHKMFPEPEGNFEGVDLSECQKTHRNEAKKKGRKQLCNMTEGEITKEARQTSREIRVQLRRTFSPLAIARLMKKLYGMAMKGDKEAAKMFFDRVMGPVVNDAPELPAPVVQQAPAPQINFWANWSDADEQAAMRTLAKQQDVLMIEPKKLEDKCQTRPTTNER